MGIYRPRGVIDATESIGTGAAALTDQDGVGFILQADPDNTDDIFIGNSTSQSLQLLPGESITIIIEHLDLVYAKSASGSQTLNVFGVS